MGKKLPFVLPRCMRKMGTNTCICKVELFGKSYTRIIKWISPSNSTPKSIPKPVSYNENASFYFWSKCPCTCDLTLILTYALTPTYLTLLHHFYDRFCTMLAEFMAIAVQHEVSKFMLLKALFYLTWLWPDPTRDIETQALDTQQKRLVQAFVCRLAVSLRLLVFKLYAPSPQQMVCGEYPSNCRVKTLRG